METPELKPCPFCGRADNLKALFVFVTCRNCGASGPGCAQEIDSVSGWNTRAAVKPKQFYQYSVQSDITAGEAANIAWLYDLYPHSRQAFSIAVESLPSELKRHFQLVDDDLWFVMDDPLKVKAEEKGASDETNPA